MIVGVAVIFALAGTAFGYFVIPEGKGDSAQCIVLRKDLADLTYLTNNRASPDSASARVVDLSNEFCR